MRQHSISIALESEGQDIKSLIKASGDASQEVRSNVALGLGKIGEPAKEAVPALIKALGDESETVRWKAVEALSQIGEPAKEIVPVLIKALGDE